MALRPLPFLIDENALKVFNVIARKKRIDDESLRHLGIADPDLEDALGTLRAYGVIETISGNRTIHYLTKEGLSESNRMLK